MCIEYNGRQYYEPVAKFGGDDGFNLVKIRDFTKINYCKNKNIKLYIIKYNENCIKSLENIFN